MIADRVSNEDIIGMLPKRPAESNKKTFGRVLAVCGSYGMSGAAYLCAKAAYRSGCGLVEILTAEENRVILQTSLPEATVTCYKSDSPDYDTILSAASRADAIALGCGLGRIYLYKSTAGSAEFKGYVFAQRTFRSYPAS